MRDFKKLLIWQKGIEIVQLVYEMTATFPKLEKYGLQSQCQRSALSIPSNIAEGSSRFSKKDHARFLEIALGSCFELETQIILAHKLNYISLELESMILKEVKEEQMMIAGLLRKMRE